MSRARPSAVDRLRRVANLERDHHRVRARRHVHRVHAALRRSDRARPSGACAALARGTPRPAARRAPARSDMSLPGADRGHPGRLAHRVRRVRRRRLRRRDPRPARRASRTRAARRSRATIGPLWEANHVWLIFSITVLFSAFPAAFSALGTALLAPAHRRAAGDRPPQRRARAPRDPPRPAPRDAGRHVRRGERGRGVLFGAVAAGLPQVSSPPRRRAVVPAIPWTASCADRRRSRGGAVCTTGGELRDAGSARSGRIDSPSAFAAGPSGWCVRAASSLAAPPSRRRPLPPCSHRLIGPALPLVIVGVAAAALSLLAPLARRYRSRAAPASSPRAALAVGLVRRPGAAPDRRRA